MNLSRRFLKHPGHPSLTTLGSDPSGVNQCFVTFVKVTEVGARGWVTPVL